MINCIAPIRYVFGEQKYVLGIPVNAKGQSLKKNVPNKANNPDKIHRISVFNTIGDKFVSVKEKSQVSTETKRQDHRCPESL